MNKKLVLRGVGLLIAVAILLVSAYFWIYKTKNISDSQETSQEAGNGQILSYKEAMKSEKPFVVLFYSQWCGYCEYFAPKFEMLSKIYKDKYNFATVNADLPESAKINTEFSLGSVPSVYIVDPTLDNRIFISTSMYRDLRKVRIELERYLRIREMIKQ